MSVTGYWSLGNLAKAACQMGFDYAKKTACSAFKQVYTNITRKLTPLKEQVIALTQDNTMLSKAAKTASTAALILSEFTKHNFNLEQISEGVGSGILASFFYYGGEDVSNGHQDNLPLTFVISSISLISFCVFYFTQQKFKFEGNTKTAFEGLAMTSIYTMLPFSVLTAGGVAHTAGRFYIDNNLLPMVPLALLIGTKYAIDTEKFAKIAPLVMELSGKAAILAGSIKATSIIRDQMMQSPLLSTILTVTSVSLLSFTPQNKRSLKDKEPTSSTKKVLGMAGVIAVGLLSHALVCRPRSLVKTEALAASLVAGSLVGAIYPDLKDSTFWTATYKRIQHRDLRILAQEFSLDRIFPKELLKLINEYTYTQRKKGAVETHIEKNVMEIVPDEHENELVSLFNEN